MHIVGPIRMAAAPLRGPWCCWCVLVVALSGSTAAQSLEQARRDGLDAGARDGRQAGFDAGYAQAFAVAEQQAFTDTLRELSAHGNVHRTLSGKVRVWAYGLAAGLVAQWLVMYVLRRVCRLPDVDWMVFPERLTEVHVGPGSGSLSPRTLERFLPLLVVLTAIGCADTADKAWSRAYQLQFDSEYRTGRAAAESHGTADGRLAGIYRASEAARTGESWQLYRVHAISAGVAGAAVGLIIQYSHLLCVRRSGYLHGLWSLLLVPGITSSYAYQVYLRRREFLIWMKDELVALRANQRLRRAQLETVTSLVHTQAVKLADLDQFLQARLLEAAHDKMAEIVAAAECEALPPEDAGSLVGQDPDSSECIPPPLESGAHPSVHPDHSPEPPRLQPAARWMPMIDSVSYSAGE